MTTLQEAQIMTLIDAYADAAADYVASDYCMAGDNSNLGERAKEARAVVVAALPQQGDDIHRAVDKAVESVAQRMRVKTVTMKCGDVHHILLPIIDSYDGHIFVGQGAAPAPQALRELSDEEIFSVFKSLRSFHAYAFTAPQLEFARAVLKKARGE